MQYLHSMVRVRDLDESLTFYCDHLGLIEVDRREHEKGRFTLVFLAAPDQLEQAKVSKTPTIELTYNWDKEEYAGGKNFGHLAFAVDDIYQTCQKLMDVGVVINRPPRCGHMAFIKSPDGISIELLQKNEDLIPQEPWLSMPNTGTW